MDFLNNIQGIGTVEIEQILFMFDKLPIICVCKDNKDCRYLCMCTDPIMEYTWLFAPITVSVLIELMEDKISIVQAFEKTNGKITLITPENEGFSYFEYDFQDIPEEELPDKTEKLENPNLGQYMEQLTMQVAEKIPMDVFVELDYVFQLIKSSVVPSKNYLSGKKSVNSKNYVSLASWSKGKIEEQLDEKDFERVNKKSIGNYNEISNIVLACNSGNNGMRASYSSEKKNRTFTQSLVMARG